MNPVKMPAATAERVKGHGGNQGYCPRIDCHADGGIRH